MIVDIAEKACTRCRIVKTTEAFHKDRNSKDGRVSHCKECVRESHNANREAIRNKQDQYRKNNRESILAKKRRHRQLNIETARENTRRWRSENAEAAKAYALRVYREGGRPIDKPWPDHPVAYTTAHCRVKATYGAAKKYLCAVCGGAQAHAWSYDHSDPNPLFYQGGGPWANRPPIPYSPDPRRYDPLCRSCHVKRDRYGGS